MVNMYGCARAFGREERRRNDQLIISCPKIPTLLKQHHTMGCPWMLTNLFDLPYCILGSLDELLQLGQNLGSI
jgi:hypothetical protein